MGAEMIVIDDPVINGFETQDGYRTLWDIDKGVVVKQVTRNYIDLPLQWTPGGNGGIDPGPLNAGIITIANTEIVLGTKAERQE